MKPTNVALIQAMTTAFQVGKDFRSPSAAVIVKRPPGATDFLVSEAWLPDVISVEIDMDIETPTRSFTVTCANANGQLSPDYRRDKYDVYRYHDNITASSPWRSVLVPETEVTIHLGYQDNYFKMLTGTIDEVNIDGSGETIRIVGRSMYKRAQSNTLIPDGKDPFVVMNKNTNVGTAVGMLLDKVNVANSVYLLREPGSNEAFLVRKQIGARREYPADVISEMVDSTFTVLVEDAHGKVHMKPMPNFTRTGKAVYTFDDFIDLKESDFTIDDSEMFNAILVKCGDKANRFTSKAIQTNILRGQYRETEVEYAWADTYEKRRYVAQALFNQMAMRWRKMTIGAPAYLPLELLDVVLVRERVSQVNWNLHVRGIRFSFSTQGLFMLLELADNTSFRVDQPDKLPPPKPPPPSDLPPFTVTDAKLTIEVWDFSVEDGDRMHIYFNGGLLKRSVYIRNKPFTLTLNLKMGPNVLKFIGVSAGTMQTLSGRFRVRRADGSILYDAGDLPDLEMPRTNVLNKSGYYDPTNRPVRNWVITRV